MPQPATTMATTGSTSSGSTSSGSTSSIRNDTSIDDDTGLPTPMSECKALEDDPSFPMDRFPTPEDELSDGGPKHGAEGELEGEGSHDHHSSSPAASTSILASVAKKHKYPLPGEKPTKRWLQGLRTGLTQELSHLRVETAEASKEVKDLLYETALLQSRLNKEINATNKAIETLRSIVDPRWVDFAMQKAGEAVETGVLEDFDDWLGDEDGEDSESQDEGEEPIDEPKAQENESLKRKRDDDESETESDIDAREAEEVELSITASVSPGKRRKLSGDSNNGYGSSDSAVARGRRRAAALGVSLATTNEDQTLVEASSRAVDERTANGNKSRGSNVLLPPDVQLAPITETSASARAPGLVGPSNAVVAAESVASTVNGKTISPTQNIQGMEIVPRRGGRPLRRQYQRVVQNGKGEPIIVDYRRRS